MADPSTHGDLRLIEEICERQTTVAKLMSAEPLVMVSKPHICWATDQLSHAERDITWLLARLAKLEAVAEKISYRVLTKRQRPSLAELTKTLAALDGQNEATEEKEKK